MTIHVREISKRFGDHRVLDRVGFDVEGGALVALLGPSGGGKSTLLRILAGLETPDSGSLWLGGVDATAVPSRDRNIGFVFQSYALFRHLTVAENVGFGLTVRKVGPVRRDARVGELLERVGLAGLGDRYPAQLSGGQRQRVALARALAPAPGLLLLDEPFGAVDAQVRQELRRWLRELHDDLGVTSIFVTHDQDEALAVADRVLVLHGGRFEQDGTPRDIVDRPASPFVAGFVGEVNRLEAQAHGGVAHWGALRLPTPVELSGRAAIFVRADDVAIEGPGIARVQRVVPLSDRCAVELLVDGAGPLRVSLPRDAAEPAPGERVGVRVARCRTFPLSP